MLAGYGTQRAGFDSSHIASACLDKEGRTRPDRMHRFAPPPDYLNDAVNARHRGARADGHVTMTRYVDVERFVLLGLLISSRSSTDATTQPSFG